MTTQKEKVAAFNELHNSGETFIIANPWDAGSARMLQGLGFKALATTSAGFAQTLGRLDGQVSLEEKLAHCRELCEVTDIPINADFENGFADSPEACAENLIKAANCGLAGASIEDYSGSELYEFELAVDRIAACAEARSKLPYDFMLTARAENLLRGVDDLDDTIKRLQAFEAAGADVLYAPGLRNSEQIKTVLESVSKSLNVLSAFMPDMKLSEYAELGVCRVSIGGGLANYIIAATIAASEDMLANGSFEWMKDATPGATISKLLS
ncbi:MAG: 2-methylisocitrate lyase [SAR86 cluster bacterium]|uniref:2-methylisocitrate lyase n=1 Tax=SAR86 cluster bacterium TaxID=2030880 RepID=A0A2A5B6A7_9GAMM|nr:MAG: 2-methylisocitrate lyase [SAR86 cluster bacterium]